MGLRGKRGERNRKEGFFPAADSDFILTYEVYSHIIELTLLSVLKVCAVRINGSHVQIYENR